LVTGLEAGHDKVKSHDGDRVSHFVFEIETTSEERVSHPDTFSEVVLDLQPGPWGDFLIRGPSSDPSVSGQGRKDDKAGEKKRPRIHGDSTYRE
tara:strand:+ start:95 stop:376 length:282 start_codon:yes stop_codon:yes gene_type:complete